MKVRETQKGEKSCFGFTDLNEIKLTMFIEYIGHNKVLFYLSLPGKPPGVLGGFPHVSRNTENVMYTCANRKQEHLLHMY